MTNAWHSSPPPSPPPPHGSGRLPTNQEVDAILRGEPHEYGRGHDSWIPSYWEKDGKKVKDWIQVSASLSLSLSLSLSMY